MSRAAVRSPSDRQQHADDMRQARQAADDEMEQIRQERVARQRAARQEKRRAAGLDGGLGGGGGADDDTLNSSAATPEQQKLQYAASLQEQNKASLANSIRMANEANQSADRTMDQLERQREQLERMDDNLDKTNDSVNRSERILKGMKSISGAISNWFTKPKSSGSDLFEDSRHAAVADNKLSQASKDGLAQQKQNKNKPTEQADQQNTNDSAAGKLRGMAGKSNSASTATAIHALADNADEEDLMLDQLSVALKQLQGKGETMNRELTVQDHLIDHLDEKVQKTTVRINKQNKTINKIL